MRPSNSDHIILRIPVKTHEISSQRRFGLPCPLYSLLLYGDPELIFHFGGFGAENICETVFLVQVQICHCPGIEEQIILINTL